jgi:hypothetical protein
MPGAGTAADLWYVGAPLTPVPAPLGGAFPYINAEAMGLNTVRSGGGGDDNIDAVDWCNTWMFFDFDADLIDDGCDPDKDGDGIGNGIDPDDDGDGFGDPQQTLHLGPTNTDPTVDNCPMVPNPGQENTDGNFIDSSPPYVPAVDDRTRARSDSMGDACDTDDDNDGILDVNEAPGPPCGSASGPTDPLNFDTDGDRYLDGVECSFGFDPASSASVPPFASCGGAGDADADKIQDRLEICFYGTSFATSDTDGDIALDGAKDGCEVASINADRIVNSLDQGKLASGISGAVPYHPGTDLNKDGVLSSIDQGLMASFIVPPGQCP